jgi:hypothetical protein
MEITKRTGAEPHRRRRCRVRLSGARRVEQGRVQVRAARALVTGIPAVLLLGMLALVSLALAACTVAPLPGRFTYVVKYEVTVDSVDPLNPPTGVSLEYREDPDILVALTAAPSVDPPWSVELPMDYDYDNPFTPELRFNSATFPNVGDKLTVSIIWKDYKVAFAEQTLEEYEVLYTGTPPASVDLVATELPK